jgi:cephalosporin hydroxylase
MRVSAILAVLGLTAGAFVAGAFYAPRVPSAAQRNMIDAFHRYYYENSRDTWGNTKWLGTITLKNPADMWIYQEMLYESKPDVLIECGTFGGGSALFFASMMDLLNKGRVLTIDIQDQPTKPRHKRIEYFLGSSTSPEIIRQIKSRIKPGEKVMLVLDSDHKRDHVLAELRAYAPLVPVGGYAVVEDTNVNGHPVFPAHGPGPMEAVDAYLKENSAFSIDRSREKFLLTFNPRGYLQRTR